MTNTLRSLVLVASLPLVPVSFGQTLTDATSIPAIGTIENRIYHSDFSATGLATSGTGNTWNAMGVTPFGISSVTTYTPGSASPYAANFPTATICAEVLNGGNTEWRHFLVSSSIAELLGTGTDEFIGGRTYCEFPLSLDDSFSDTYTVGGNTNNDVTVYVASGQILAPWGTIPNVVMFQVNGGPYTFYMASNLLDAIGSYMPGFGLDLWQVDVVSTVTEPNSARIGVWPSPAIDVAHVFLPFAGANFQLFDAQGRVVLEGTSTIDRLDIEVGSLTPGIYTFSARSGNSLLARTRFVVQ